MKKIEISVEMIDSISSMMAKGAFDIARNTFVSEIGKLERDKNYKISLVNVMDIKANALMKILMSMLSLHEKAIIEFSKKQANRKNLVRPYFNVMLEWLHDDDGKELLKEMSEHEGRKK